MALISPHRAQNNAILKRLGEMMADTVESTDMKDLSLPLMDTVEGTRGQSGTLSYLG
jgi:hypothetical protein